MQASRSVFAPRRIVSVMICAALLLLCPSVAAAQDPSPVPPRVLQAQRFLALRGSPHLADSSRVSRTRAQETASPAAAPASLASIWQPLGPASVASAAYGPVTGRVTSLALDPSDPTGNHLYAGTTGGGVWVSQNAASGTSQPQFTPLTDFALAQVGITPPAISIGALTVQPGGTGVILAGTGDPNDALDSYYGAGVLRSTDWGHSWTRITKSVDDVVPYTFVGMGFAGFAWSTTDPQLVVAAVSRAYEASLVNAERNGYSISGLYYSTDAGATWHLSTIQDGTTRVQGPGNLFRGEVGTPATSVVWNPVRHLFLAAVRFHGYYKSTDGITWTRLVSQPGSSLTAALCPANGGISGSLGCPIFRGSLAVNPVSGDTFAWTVDLNNQDQGLWQDACNASGGNCASADPTFARQWSTTPLQVNTAHRPNTIPNGDYTLALAAVPSGQDTILLAGAADLWKCNLAMGCTWRNTTNTSTCMSAKVAPYQHALEWNTANHQQILVGNDGGLWSSMDAIGETGADCSPADANHWQNLNPGLGSLAEIDSLALTDSTNILAGLGANGSAGIKGSTLPAAWPQVLSGEGGPVAIAAGNPPTWYVNNGAGVSIHACTKLGACTAADFGSNPVIGNAQVNNDGLQMTAPAPFMVDPLDPTQLLVATCRMWRGPASGSGWTTANAISQMFDGNTGAAACHGNATIRSIAALPLPDGGEVVYAGTYGHDNGGASLPGHVLRGRMSASGTWTWQDLTTANTSLAFNLDGLDISSIVIDPSDLTGSTVYITVAGLPPGLYGVQQVYRTTDAGAHWLSMESNLPYAPANALAIDPSNPKIVYVANDSGVFVTQAADTCAQPAINCWAAFGTGLPQSPVVALSIPGGSHVLVAGTYGRGLWQVPLLGAPLPPTTVSLQPASLTFVQAATGSQSSAQTITVTNTGAAAFAASSVAVTGDFLETDNCTTAVVAPGASCAIQVVFAPAQSGTRTGQLTLQGNLSTGSLAASLSGTAVAPGEIYFVPGKLDLGTATVGQPSAPFSIMVENSSVNAIAIQSVTVSGPFSIKSNACGNSVAANSDCQILLIFTPTASGAASGMLTIVDGAGTQTAQLSGTGVAAADDSLSPATLSFPATIIAQNSPALTVTLKNGGGAPLTSIQQSITGPFSVTSNCTTQLIGGSSCSINVLFTPTAQGVQTGTLTVSDILRDQTVALTGIGLLAPRIVPTPTTLTFGGQIVGQASSPLTLSFSNPGEAPLDGFGFQFTGPSAASFSIANATCGKAIAAGASCTVQVLFTPSAAGAASAALVASSSTAGVTAVSIPLGGTGQTASAISVSPAQLTFAALPVGQSSPAQTITVNNTGGSAAAGLALTASGPFSIVQNTCPSSLAAGANCSAGVIFTPVQNGAAAGAVTIASTTVSTPAPVALSGTGGLSGVVLAQPANIAFPITGVGQVSSPVTITLSNFSISAALSGIELTASTGFKVSSTTCSATLAPGASCTAAVTFLPAAPGAVKGSLIFASTTLASPATVELSGIGFEFAFVPSSVDSQTVVSGQTASFTLTLGPNAGAAGTFAFECKGLPQYAGCIFSPSSNTVAAGATGTEVLQITTSQTGAALVPENRPVLQRTAPLLLALVLCPLMARRRRLLLRAGLLVCLLSLGVSGCASAGGGGGSTPAPSTSHSVAPGTYAVQVVATANSLPHTLTLTLKVN